MVFNIHYTITFVPWARRYYSVHGTHGKWGVGGYHDRRACRRIVGGAELGTRRRRVHGKKAISNKKKREETRKKRADCFSKTDNQNCENLIFTVNAKIMQSNAYNMFCNFAVPGVRIQVSGTTTTKKYIEVWLIPGKRPQHMVHHILQQS